MSYEAFIALRYLSASRKRAHVALISTISVLGLAVGVAALVISLALLSGFQDRIRAQMAIGSITEPHSAARSPGASSSRCRLHRQFGQWFRWAVPGAHRDTSRPQCRHRNEQLYLWKGQ